MSFPKLNILYDKIITKKTKKELTNLDKIRLVFLKLYEDYENHK